MKTPEQLAALFGYKSVLGCGVSADAFATIGAMALDQKSFTLACDMYACAAIQARTLELSKTYLDCARGAESLHRQREARKGSGLEWSRS